MEEHSEHWKWELEGFKILELLLELSVRSKSQFTTLKVRIGRDLRTENGSVILEYRGRRKMRTLKVIMGKFLRM